MRWIYTIPLRLRSAFRRQAVESELDEELQTHLDHRIAHEMANGRTWEQARAIALRDMGGIEQRKEECRDMRHMKLLDNLARDVRFAFRMLSRSPSFTIAALSALALGIGANTAAFSVVNSVLLKPMPFSGSDRLVMVFNSRPLMGIQNGGVGIADYLDWKDRSRSFETLDIFRTVRYVLTGDGNAEQLAGMTVTATAFDTLKVKPLLGRTFLKGEDEPGKTLTVVVSEGFWRRRYGSDAHVLGKQIVLNGSPHTIIGILPAGVEFGPRDVEAWAILPLVPPTRRGPFFARGLGRLKPGVTVEQAAAEMQAIARQVERENPPGYEQLQFPVVALHEVIVGRIRPFLWTLAGAVMLVLVIAISNVANLLLARGTARQRETAIRLSIGAGRGQLVRQFMTESVILSMLGGGLGVALAAWGIRALHWLGPRDMPRLSEIHMDAGVLAYSLLLSLVSALLFGLAPAFGASTAALKLRTGQTRSHTRARGILVIAQVTLSVVLLIGAGLLIRSFTFLERVDTGFDASPNRILSMHLSLAGPRYADLSAASSFYEELLDRVRQLPGVEVASIANTIPPDRLDHTDDYQIEGKMLPAGQQHPVVPILIVSHDYFRTLNIPLIRGRYFDAHDRSGGVPVTIISQAMARRHFPSEDPIGRRIRYGGKALEIIGVVGDVKYQGLEQDNQPVFYQSNAQNPQRRQWLLARTSNDPLTTVAAIRRAAGHIDSDVPLDRVGTMAEALTASVSLPRFRLLLMTVFAVTALLLAAVGIYGVVTYSVEQRRQEIGVRMALGASKYAVAKLVIGQGGRFVIAGVVLGVAGAMALTQLLQKMLYGISPFDAVTFASVVVLLGAVAMGASLVPAWRAARIDPLTALRQD